MKKIVIFILVAVIVAAALPVIGNKIVESSLEDRLATLDSFGLEVSKAQTDSSYLSTKKHFEFLLSDSEKFIAYLNQYSDQQIPPYVNAMFNGVVIGADVEYSNFPMSKDLTVDIYPLALSKSMMHDIKKEDLDFYNYLEKFLHSKGFLYHINYNIMSEDFDGYVKDITENYTLKDGTDVTLELLNATYSGNGDLIAPNSLDSDMEKIQLTLNNTKTKLTFLLDAFSSSSSFESQSTYITSGDLKNLKLIVNTTDEDISFNVNDIKVNFSSNTQGDKAEINGRSSFKDLSVKSNKIDLVMKNLIYDMAINGLDKDSLEELRVVTSQTNTASPELLQEEIQNAAIKLISHGLELDIAQFSLENAILNQKENLEGFNVKTKLNIKEDKDLAQKIQTSPFLVANNIEMTINVKLSKQLYAKLNNDLPMTAMANNYAKNDGNDVLFDITFANGELRMNGQALR